MKAEVLSPCESPKACFIPFFASPVQAGFPSPATDYDCDALDLNEYLIAHKSATFFVRARGNSMVGAGIQDNDLLIVDRSIGPEHRDIVIAIVDNDFTVKRLHKQGKRILLLPENPEYAPIEFKDGQECQIWGIVTSVIHRFL